MSIFDITQVALERAISGAHLRHETLASNLANVNTAGYQARDVDFHTSLQRALETGDETEPEMTTAQVMLRADGSGVDAEAESAKLAQNGLEMQALSQVAGARIDILKYAIGTR